MKGALDCLSARCGLDAGCRKDPDGSFICICTHDLSHELPGKPCPRNVVFRSNSLGSKTKPRITILGSDRRNHMIFSNFSKSSPLPTGVPEGNLASDTSSALTLTWAIPVFCFVALVVVLVIGIQLLKWFRVYRMTNRNRKIVRLSRNVMAQELLTTNINYNSLDPLTVNRTTITPQSLFLLREWIEIQEEIGEGCFGKVFRGRLRQPDASQLPLDPAYINLESSEAVAIKVLKVSSPGISSTTAQQDILREAEIMASFSHENILSLRGIVINECSIGPWVVFEYMELGDLSQLLRSSNNLLSEDANIIQSPSYSLQQVDLYSIASQIANGMKYLTSRNFVHRDLACRNCLIGERSSVRPALDTKGRSNLIVKISDFGMSRDLHANDYYKMGGSRLLPIRWMAPESILFGKFTPESDVWSFGVVLWEIFSMGALPYYGHSNEEVVKMVVEGIYLQPPISTTPTVRQLMIDGCWKKFPPARLSFSEIHEQLFGLVSSVLSEESKVVRSNSYVLCDYLQPLPDQENVF